MKNRFTARTRLTGLCLVDSRRQISANQGYFRSRKRRPVASELFIFWGKRNIGLDFGTACHRNKPLQSHLLIRDIVSSASTELTQLLRPRVPRVVALDRTIERSSPGDFRFRCWTWQLSSWAAIGATRQNSDSWSCCSIYRWQF